MPDTTTLAEKYFWHQDPVQAALEKAKDRDRLARSYLFVGPEGAGKWAAAQWLAMALLCEQEDRAARPCLTCPSCKRARQGSHADWHALFPVPKATADEDRAFFLKEKQNDPFTVIRFPRKPNLAIDDVRELISELHKTAAEGGLKVSIIASADQMMGDAQTILLKSIEEPPPGTHFILTSSDPGRILPTVRSRCQVIRFAAAPPDQIAARLADEQLTNRDDAEIIAQLCGGGWGNAVRLADEKLAEWRKTAAKLWAHAFTVSPAEMIDMIEKDFRNKPFEDAVQAFDVWALLLRQDCDLAFHREHASEARPSAPIRDLETAWGCWRILQNGRATLWVNVIPRSAVKGTFLMLRRRLHLQ
jgi:DNA polymerase-3 subunit delta'